MSDSTVFEAGQSLRRREMMKAAVVGAAGVTAGAASSGTAAADDDNDDGGFMDYMPEPSARHVFVNPGIEALYNYVNPFGDEGYTQESVHEMSAENYRNRVYYGIEAIDRHVRGSVDDLLNYVHAGEPTESPLAEMAYSELRTTALQAVQEGKSVSDAREEGVEKALEELSVPYQNAVNQWNEYIYDCVRYLFAYIDTDEVEWSGDGDEVDHGADETLEELTIPSEAIIDDQDGLPGFPEPYDFTMSRSFHDWSPNHPWEVQVDELEKPNGEIAESYRFIVPFNATNINNHIKRSSSAQHSSDGSTHSIRVYHPDESSITVTASYHIGMYRIVNAIEDIADDIEENGGDTIEEIMQAYEAGDIGEQDLLSSYDLVRQYSDSGEMTRQTAELLAAGLDAPDDLTHAVTIDHPDVGEQTGRLFLSWDWSELRGWEYDFDPESYLLEIDPASRDDEPELTVVFTDDGDENEVVLEPEDFEDGVAALEAQDGILERIERHSQGDLNAHIPVGETTNDWESAIFLYEDEDGETERADLDPEESFELVAVKDEDGSELDKLELSGWQNVERDPALSLREAERTEEQYVTVDDLEETGGGGGGGGGDSNTLLIGGMVLALIGMILAALMGDS